MEVTTAINEYMYLVKQPFNQTFTGVTVIIGGDSVGIVDSGLKETPTRYVFPLLRSLGREPEEIEYVVNTHYDWDHIEGNSIFKREAGAKIAAHELDAEDIGDVDLKLKDGDLIRLGNRRFTVIHTPGHTPGSICLYDQDTRILITGDSVQGSGSRDGLILIRTGKEQYINSMKKLLKLEVSLIVMDHPYMPFGEAVLSSSKAKEMILKSIKAAEKI